MCQPDLASVAHASVALASAARALLASPPQTQISMHFEHYLSREEGAIRGLIGRQLFPSSQLPASQPAASVVSLQPGGRQSQFWLSPRPLLSLRTLVDVTELESLSACVQGKEGNPFTPKCNTVNGERHAGRKKGQSRLDCGLLPSPIQNWQSPVSAGEGRVGAEIFREVEHGS